MDIFISEWMFLAGVLICIIACFGALFRCGKYPDCDKSETKRFIAIKKRNIWIRTSIIWHSLYYWSTLNSILSTLIVLYISCYGNMQDNGMRIRVFVYSALSLFSSICPFVVNLGNVARAYRTAYNLVDKALSMDGNLGEAVSKGEDIITSAHI